MIERLLAAFAEGAEDGAAPRTAVGPEEIADILWLAARVDPAATGSTDGGVRPPGPDGPDEAPEPPPRPDDPAAAAGRAGPDADGAVQLFPAVPARPERPAAPASDAPASDAPARRGVPLRLPRTASLDDPLALMRSLRPVGRRSIGGPGEELDEQLTIERSIEAMVPTPVLRPAESRWLDLALVVDTHPSMLLWSDLVAELRGVFTRSGVFRDVRTWQLTGTAPGGTPMLARGRGGPPRNPLELADPAGRRLILLVSDTVAGGWQETPLLRVLRHWSAHNAVAVLNVLPERLWTRGAVRPVPFAVRSDRPAAATRSWQRVPAARRARGGGPVVPVVGLASGSLARLVRTVSGDGRWRRLACLRLDAAPAPGTAPPHRAATALEAVERFRAGASPTAQQLAAHLAAVPLTLPVMTLVRRSLLRDSEHGHLAEVALGGLFAPWEGQQRPEDAEFDFLPGVRDVLLGSQLRGDVAAVRELVRRRVWEFMHRHRGTGPDFSATRVTPGEEGRRRVPAGALPFAERPAVEGVPAERAPAVRVVRVDFDPQAGPREVGVLLAPRLVLTAGHVPQARDAVAWVRSGGREAVCRAVWWDEGTPRVLLLESEEDLADPDAFVPPDWAAMPFGSGRRMLVEGVTDPGERITLTGELIRTRGTPNGELVELSAEPESWTHFVGGPVLLNDQLVGIVHTVWHDRMAFLTGRALIEQDAFRAVVYGHRPAARSLARAWGGSPGPRVVLDVRAGEGTVPRDRTREAELSDLLMRLLEGPDVAGQLLFDGDKGTLTLDPPGALGRAGVLLDELPRVMARYSAAGEGTSAPLAVALGFGGAARPIGRRRIREWLRGAAYSGTLLLVLSRALHEELVDRVGPAALADCEPLGDPDEGWAYEGPPGRLARLLREADQSVDEAPDWPRCGFRAAADGPPPCTGIRPPGRRACLAHLPDAERDAVLRSLGPGSSVDFRGTTFGDGLLERVLDAVRDPGTGHVRLGEADFTAARFEDGWEESEPAFTRDADFTRAVFTGPARFLSATFGGEASFEHAVFHREAAFEGSTFAGRASFANSSLAGPGRFASVTWAAEVSFRRAVLEGEAVFEGMTAEGRADFTGVISKSRLSLAESTFAERVSFAYAVCEGPLSAVDTHFADAAAFDHLVCEGEAVFRDARFDGPASFYQAVFQGLAAFDTSRFEHPLLCAEALFRGPVLFRRTACAGGASFDDAVFEGMFRWVDSRAETAVSFGGTRFRGAVRFLRGKFVGDMGFDRSVFESDVVFEACNFGAVLLLTGSTFHGPATLTVGTLAQPLDLPDGWSATETDGVWEITSPERPESGDA
ncbi:SAV_2336 N-terminal domain-related protein [Streptomyces sp. NPDC047976]|uniref:SAV_2336 N-terminal domain-related protein n=1 Tax=Streptomyces sp. NPDC047976 TaxID=3155746 RepID=UPI00341B807A